MELFFDIETVANDRIKEFQDFKLSAIEEEAKAKNYKTAGKEEEYIENKLNDIESKAGLNYATAKVCCISFKLNQKDQPPKTIFNTDEKELLKETEEYLTKVMLHFKKHNDLITLIAHYGYAFDTTMLRLRYLANGMKINPLLNSDHSRDLREAIFGTRYLHGFNIKLDDIAWILQLDPKTGKGSEVQDWYDNGEHERIAEYCEYDTILVEKIYNTIKQL